LRADELGEVHDKGPARMSDREAPEESLQVQDLRVARRFAVTYPDEAVRVWRFVTTSTS
jgi:hypothetical protein